MCIFNNVEDLVPESGMLIYMDVRDEFIKQKRGNRIMALYVSSDLILSRPTGCPPWTLRGRKPNWSGVSAIQLKQTNTHAHHFAVSVAFCAFLTNLVNCTLHFVSVNTFRFCPPSSNTNKASTMRSTVRRLQPLPAISCLWNKIPLFTAFLKHWQIAEFLLQFCTVLFFLEITASCWFLNGRREDVFPRAGEEEVRRTAAERGAAAAAAAALDLR